MRFEALDITVESRGPALWVFLSGPFHGEQVPNIREKILGLIESGNRQLVVNLEQVVEVDAAVPPMFLDLLNMVRAKGGDLRLIYRNKTVSDAFAAYRHVIPTYPDAAALTRGRFFMAFQRGRNMSRRTGVRMSVPVALFLLFLISGWFLSLALVIHRQGRRIREQSEEIRDLTVWKEQALLELNDLHERLRPMEQLGIIESPPSEGDK
jgi:anti-anti-sigma factor